MDEKQLAEALNTINDCLVKVGERLNAIEKYVSELPTPDKTYYKPNVDNYRPPYPSYRIVDGHKFYNS